MACLVRWSEDLETGRLEKDDLLSIPSLSPSLVSRPHPHPHPHGLAFRFFQEKRLLLCFLATVLGFSWKFVAESRSVTDGFHGI